MGIEEDIIRSYEKTKSVWKTGKEVGLAGQTIHKKLVKMGIKRTLPKFSESEFEILRKDYLKYRKMGRLSEFAKRMGRTKPFICRKAAEIGLTDIKGGREFAAVWKYMSREEAEKIWEDFKSDKRGMVKYCIAKEYDDLGFSRKMRELFPEEWDHVLELKRPKTSMYALGRSFEYKIKKRLEEIGFFVIRSPQSKSPTDLVAIKKGELLFVQCKRGGEMAVKEWNELFDLAESVGAIPILAKTTPPRGYVIKKIIARKDGSKNRQPYCDFEISGMRP